MDRQPVFSVVGLDLSLTGTGVCVIKGDEVTFNLIKTVPKNFTHYLERIDFIANKILELIPPADAVSLVLVEDYFIPNGKHQVNAAMGLVELGTAVRLGLWKSGYYFATIAPTQLKKFVSGKGNIKKNVVVKEVFKRWGIDTNNDNIADAIVLAQLAKSCVKSNAGVLDNLIKPQIETVKTVIKNRPFFNIP